MEEQHFETFAKLISNIATRLLVFVFAGSGSSALGLRQRTQRAGVVVTAAQGRHQQSGGQKVFLYKIVSVLKQKLSISA